MVLIQLINKYFAILGISSSQLQNSHKFNARARVTFLAYGSCISSNVMYIFLEVNNLVDFVECLFMAFAAFGSSVAFTIIIWKIEKLFELLNDFENIIQESV